MRTDQLTFPTYRTDMTYSNFAECLVLIRRHLHSVSPVPALQEHHAISLTTSQLARTAFGLISPSQSHREGPICSQW
jgi:hypothetical protein